MKLKRQVFIGFLMLFFSNWIAAQSLDPVLVSTAGGYFDGGTASLSWSLGESVIATEDAGSQQLTQGFHQTNLEITAVSDLESTYPLAVYPNPNSGALIVDLKAVPQDCRIEIYDPLGRLLLQQQAISHTLSTLNIGHFCAGHYYLRVYNEQSVLKVFKIQKI